MLRKMLQFKPKSNTVVSQIKVPGIYGSMLIFWDANDKLDTSNNLGKRGFWYIYQTQAPPMYIGVKKSDVMEFIKSWMCGPGTLLHVPNTDRYRGRFITEAWGMEGIVDCAVSTGESDFYIVPSATYFTEEF